MHLRLCTVTPVVIGLDPFQIEKAWHLMDLHAPGNPMAATPIDMAMHDIMGKALKTPVYNLLGGIYREKVPIAAIVGFDKTEVMVKECREWLDIGAKAIRIKVGLGLRQDMVNTEAVRKAIGDAPDRFILAADCTVPAETPWENLKIAIQAAHEYKR